MNTKNPNLPPDNPDEFEILAEAFHRLDCDTFRWDYMRLWGKNFIVFLHDDYTCAYHTEDMKEERTCFHFEDHLGTHDGVQSLLDTLNIPWEIV